MFVCKGHGLRNYLHNWCFSWGNVKGLQGEKQFLRTILLQFEHSQSWVLTNLHRGICSHPSRGILCFGVTSPESVCNDQFLRFACQEKNWLTGKVKIFALVGLSSFLPTWPSALQSLLLAIVAENKTVVYNYKSHNFEYSKWWNWSFIQHPTHRYTSSCCASSRWCSRWRWSWRWIRSFPRCWGNIRWSDWRFRWLIIKSILIIRIFLGKKNQQRKIKDKYEVILKAYCELLIPAVLTKAPTVCSQIDIIDHLLRKKGSMR